jgi:hypothetical protein
MAKMFVANCTQQAHLFLYRLPESSGIRSQHILPGAQIQISGDLTTPQIESIVRQHAKYGMVHVGDIERTRPFTSLCWQLDKPVNVNAIMKGLDHNHRILDARGQQFRKVAAVVAASKAAELAPAPVPTYDVSVVEETEGQPQISEGYRVTENPDQSGRPPKAGRGRRAA